MARRGDGIYLRGRTWWLDFMHDGERHVARLGKGITRTVAGELARVKRGEALKGEAGIGRKRKDITFDAARDEFKKWAAANKRARTVRTYTQCLDALAKSFAGRRLSAISTFDVERHKRTRLEAGVRVMVNRELAVLRALYNRCRDWGKYEGDNPVVKVRPVKESAGRLRYLEAEEIDALVTALLVPRRQGPPVTTCPDGTHHRVASSVALALCSGHCIGAPAMVAGCWCGFASAYSWRTHRPRHGSSRQS